MMKKLTTLMLLSLMSFNAFACDTCEAQLYTPEKAFSDLAKSSLRFIGRDYPNPGQTSGNLHCIYENDDVYVIHEGCRPDTTRALAVFSGHIISKNGGTVSLYMEGQGNYNPSLAGPSFDGTWRVSSAATPKLSSHMNFRGVSQFYAQKQANFSISQCSIGSPSGNMFCTDGVSDRNQNIENTWRSPGTMGFKAAHDLILFAPRK